MEAGTRAAADHLATVTAAAEASVAAQRGGMGGDSDGQYRLQVEALRTQMEEVRQRCVATHACMHARPGFVRGLRLRACLYDYDGMCASTVLSRTPVAAVRVCGPCVNTLLRVVLRRWWRCLPWAVCDAHRSSRRRTHATLPTRRHCVRCRRRSTR
jgi:hypothetical protein